MHVAKKFGLTNVDVTNDDPMTGLSHGPQPSAPFENPLPTLTMSDAKPVELTKSMGEDTVAGARISQVKRKNSGDISETDKKKAKERVLPKTVMVTIDTEHGRKAIAINPLKEGEPEKLERFLADNGYASDVNPWVAMIDSCPNNARPHKVRLEKIAPRKTELALPELGQSHEMEFGAMRIRHHDGTHIGQAEELAISDQRFNTKTALMIVSETLGKEKPDATTEIVSGPYSKREDLEKVIDTTDAVLDAAKAKEKPLADVLPEGPLKLKPQRGARIKRDKLDDDDPGVQTTIDIPIRGASAILSSKDNGLFDEPAELLKGSMTVTNALVKRLGLDTKPGSKLWETLNLFVWMNCCASMLEQVNAYQKDLAGNDVAGDWMKNGGKGFYGVLPRFSPGDLLRGGLKPEDSEKLAALMKTSDAQREVTAACSSVLSSFVGGLAKGSPEEQQIAKLMIEGDKEVQLLLHRGVKEQLVPGGNKSRFPKDTTTRYGDVVKQRKDNGKQTPSLSMATGQFRPGRKIVGADDAPVSGAFEMRRGSFAPNKAVQEYFHAPTDERAKEELDKVWSAHTDHQKSAAATKKEKAVS